MASSEILSTYICKLSHPIREIRERALKLLKTKLQLGWELDDKLAGTRELLEGLLAWFEVQKPSLQTEALELFLTTIKTKSGSYITREFGIKKIIETLNKIRHKIEPGAQEAYSDLVETLRFLNSVESDENVNIPRLHLPDVTSSESDGSSSSGYYNIPPNIQSSKESSISNFDINLIRNDVSKTTDGVRVLLFPWVELCTSDSKTMLLVEDALKMLKSTRRCCRFIRDVFLRDFPAEIFLNRPNIIKNLLTISDGSHTGRPGEALHVLLCITRALRSRLSQLTCLDLVQRTHKSPEDEHTIEDGVRSELEKLGCDGVLDTPVEDGLAVLRQLPAPLYALDTLHAVLGAMARSALTLHPADCAQLLDTKELNTCLNLVENLIELLLECVSEDFWFGEHNVKTHRDISHKSCMVMRLLGDLLGKYRQLFHEQPESVWCRAAWLRLARGGERLARWTRGCALAPRGLLAALQAAQLDPATHLFYPHLLHKLTDTLQNTRTSIDQEYKSKYRELTKLFNSMEDAVTFMKNKNSCRSSNKVLTCISNALPVLELFQSDTFLNDIADILLKKAKDLRFSDGDWSQARAIALRLMAHNLEWVQSRFYTMLAETVKMALVGDETHQVENEKCLTLICDVGILTEICCHGLSSTYKEVERRSSEIMLYLLRGRLILSESCWWRLLASMLPVMPLLHVYAAHDTQLGKAICKSLEKEIAECMGVSRTEIICGLARLMFVRCVAVQLDAAHDLCKILDDDRYLPPKETLRADILLNALKRIEPQDFNVDFTSSPSKSTQTTGLEQILEVLKQDMSLDSGGEEFVPRHGAEPTLEPSLRRSSLQQLAVMLRQQDIHEAFLQHDGLKIIIAILRMSLTVDDYLAFPECAISCVSILNSVSFPSRHSLSKIPDLPALLVRVILVFPANDSAVLMSAQVLSLVVWAGFVLQELDASRRRVPALPLHVTQRTTLPFNVNTYWTTSPNAEHSYVEWVVSEEEWRSAVRVRWWCAVEGGARSLMQTVPPTASQGSLHPTAKDAALLRTACPLQAATNALVDLQNATTHKQVNEALSLLESFTQLVAVSSVPLEEWAALPWQLVKRFLCAPPASPRDAALLGSLLHLITCYMDNVPPDGGTMSWIKSYFLGHEATVVSLLGRDQLFPQQNAQDAIEVTQLHTQIVRVLLRCVLLVEHQGEYDTKKMESLVKILTACLERIDLKNFHMLGYLNELMRCIRYALNSRYCKLSEDTVISCMKLMTKVLSGCASGGGRKGQACRLDAMLSVLALLHQIHEDNIPIQRWSEAWSQEAVRAAVACGEGAYPALRAASLHAAAALALHANMLPHLLQAIEEESLSQFAMQIFCQCDEANVVRTAAANLLTAVTSRISSRSDGLECDVLGQLSENNFLENCLDILVEFCNTKEYNQSIELNVSLSVLERRPQLEVRAKKRGDVNISPTTATYRGPIPPSAALVAALADVLHNMCAFSRCPVHEWTEKGIYRMLFRCASWADGTVREVHKVRTSVCRALVAASPHKCVRASLATTKDCLHDLLKSLTPLHEDVHEVRCARTQALLLLASLLSERAASDAVWMEFVEKESSQLFRLLLQCLESDEREFQDAGIYCLTQLIQSAVHKRHVDQTKDASYVEFYDNLKTPFIDGVGVVHCAGDGSRVSDCQPEFMAEELCKALINLYQKLSMHGNKYQLSEDERWRRVCSCLASVLSVSPRSRTYGVHRQLPRALLAELQAVRDHLSVVGKPVEVIKNANQNPVLCTLNWLLTLMDCSMVECQSAKESFAEDNLAVSLNRLWPWCMINDELRLAAMHLVYTFANDCPKAWSAMCMCVGGRSLVGEVCAVCVREAALFARPRPERLLLLALHALRRCLDHHHCRAIILKSEVVSSMFKLCVRSRGAGCGVVCVRWAAVLEALTRHAEGAGAVLALRVSPPSLPPTLRARLLPALAHAAHHHRHTFLQSHDLLELLSGTLLAGDTAEVVSAARAVWSLAANNHKAKLLLRSAGVSAAVTSALQRCQRSSSDPATQRAVQLLTYTNNILAT